LLFLVLLFPTVAVADFDLCPLFGNKTTLFSYTPQVGIAGITRVYIIGVCFGASGTVSIGGVQVPSYDIFMWSDGEIILGVPDSAQTGAIEVHSQAYGSDTSTNEANGNNRGWSGNGLITNNGIFTVFAPNYPSLYGSPSKIDPAGPSVPKYVEGTWNYVGNGTGSTAQYVLSQGTQNTDGSYPVSGTVSWSDNWGNRCSQALMGTLDTRGVLVINAEDNTPGGCGSYSEEWVILNSGDATSQGWFWEPQSDPGWCTPPPNFPDGLGYYCSDVPLFKSQTDMPSTESPGFLGWVAANQSPDPTHGAWQRTMPLSSDGLTEFPGRFVFEQVAPGGGGVDACYNGSNGNSPFPPFTRVTGGGWYVNANGVWGSGWAPVGGTNLLHSDDIGINSDGVQWYQQQVGECSIKLQQTMFIDSLDGATAYNTAGPYGATNQLEIDISTAPGAGVCTSVTPSGGSKATACKDYPPH